MKFTTVNALDKYKVVDKKGVVVANFRTKIAAKNWLKANNKYYLYELELIE